MFWLCIFVFSHVYVLAFGDRKFTLAETWVDRLIALLIFS